MRPPAPTPGSSPSTRLVPAGAAAGPLPVLLAPLVLLVLLAGCAVGGGADSGADEPEPGGRPVGGVAVDPVAGGSVAGDDAGGGSVGAHAPGVGSAGSAQGAHDRAVAGRRPTRFRASGVLAAWDRARAHAFADGDSTALRALYVPGSAAGTSDLALLRAYRARGLRVEGMRMQLLAVEVLHEARRVLRLKVTDRLTGAVVVGQDTRVPLPRDHASTRVVELRRPPSGRWRMAWVRQ